MHKPLQYSNKPLSTADEKVALLPYEAIFNISDDSGTVSD